MYMYAKATECIYRQSYSHKANKSLGLGLHGVVGKYPLSVSLVKTCPIKSNRVLEDLNITDYPQSVITPASLSFRAAGTIARG